MTNDLHARVDVALRAFGCDADAILPVHDLQGDLGIDSIEIVEVAALICRDSGRPDVRLDVAGVRTVEDLVARVRALVAPAETV